MHVCDYKNLPPQKKKELLLGKIWWKVILSLSLLYMYKKASQGSSVKNGLKVKQLAKQPLTLKTLMQKMLVGLWVKKYFVNFKFTEGHFTFTTTVLGTN